jgi:carboxymethylenebutenolidase
MQKESLELTAGDGHRFQTYCARPRLAPRGAVVVIQEIFGVNAHIRAVCDRFTADGFVAIAPSLYDRAERGVELAYGPEGVARGREVRQQVTDDMAMLDVAATVAWARGQGHKAGVIGFCWGGTLAWLAAARLAQVSAAVAYYGTNIAGYVQEAPKVPVLLHFGEQDQHIPPPHVEKIRAAHPAIDMHLYPAGHGFNCDERASYEPASARLAWERTQAFLAAHVAV